MKLSDISKTAIPTLKSRVIESQNKNPLVRDSMAVYCIDKLVSSATEEEWALLPDR